MPEEMTFHSASLREWQPGYFEAVLPEELNYLTSQENRNHRVARTEQHILAGAHRNLCRCFVYTEDEWRAAVRLAGREPNNGWIMQPRPAHIAPPPQPAPEPPRQPAEPEQIGMLMFDASDDIPW